MTVVATNFSCDRRICLASVAHEGGGLVGDSRCSQQHSVKIATCLCGMFQR
jgi:hypothetical protein